MGPKDSLVNCYVLCSYNCRKNKEMEPKSKQCPFVDVTGDWSKVRSWKEYCIENWNESSSRTIWNWFKSTNQSELVVVKQEMARVSINILGISELKLTGIGTLNSDYLYIYYWGQESLRRNGVAIIVKKRIQSAELVCNDRMISVYFQGKPFNITVIQVYALTSNA